MKHQNFYKIVNLDFSATHEKISSTIPGAIRERAGRKPQVDAGALSFTLPSTKIKILIFPKSPHKMEVTWQNQKEKETQLPQIISLLVPFKDKKITVKPLFTNIIKIAYPGPVSIPFAWCREKDVYISKRFITWLLRFGFFILVSISFVPIWWPDIFNYFLTVGSLWTSYLLIEHRFVQKKSFF